MKVGFERKKQNFTIFPPMKNIFYYLWKNPLLALPLEKISQTPMSAG